MVCRYVSDVVICGGRGDRISVFILSRPLRSSICRSWWRARRCASGAVGEFELDALSSWRSGIIGYGCSAPWLFRLVNSSHMLCKGVASSKSFITLCNTALLELSCRPWAEIHIYLAKHTNTASLSYDFACAPSRHNRLDDCSSFSGTRPTRTHTLSS